MYEIQVKKERHPTLKWTGAEGVFEVSPLLASWIIHNLVYIVPLKKHIHGLQRGGKKKAPEDLPT